MRTFEVTLESKSSEPQLTAETVGRLLDRKLTDNGWRSRVVSASEIAEPTILEPVQDAGVQL